MGFPPAARSFERMRRTCESTVRSDTECPGPHATSPASRGRRRRTFTRVASSRGLDVLVM